MDRLPLLGDFKPSSIIAWQGRQAITCRQFLADVAQLAQNLPRHAYMFNLCRDRYRFLLAFAAALVRQQVNMLPPGEAPQMLLDIARRYPDTYCLTDEEEPIAQLEVFRYRETGGNLASSAMDTPLLPPEQVAAIVFTSGSTGEPKANVKTWEHLVAESRMARTRFWPHGARPAAAVGTVPPQHMYGLQTTILLPMQSGFGLSNGRPLFPEDIRVALESVPAPRILVTTPLHIRACVLAGTGLPELEFILSATAPLSPGLARQAEDCFGCEVLEIYGCSEAGSVATRRTVEGNLWRTYEEMRLTSVADQCFVCGPSVKEPVELNDVIQLRGEHEFSLHGRVADLINIAGKRTSLSSLNHHLSDIAGVIDGVFFMPEETPDSVSRLVAFVVAPGLSKRDVLNELRQRIDAVFLPRPLYMVDDLPRSETGKLAKAALELLAFRLARQRKQPESA